MKLLPRIEESGLISEMRRHGKDATWVYTPYTMYAFHARLRVIPELAVLPPKRFWSQQITDAQVVGIVQQYLPDEILVYGQTPQLADLLQKSYLKVFDDNGYCLYICKAKEPPQR